MEHEFPWTVRSERHPWQGYYIRDAKDNVICATPFDSIECKRNADFIQRAVNCHTELLEALEIALIWRQSAMPETRLQAARDAIEKAVTP